MKIEEWTSSHRGCIECGVTNMVKPRQIARVIPKAVGQEFSFALCGECAQVLKEKVDKHLKGDLKSLCGCSCCASKSL